MSPNDLWLIPPIISTLLLLSFFTAGKPAPESGAVYSYVDGSKINTTGGSIFSFGGAFGQACCMGNPGNYTVAIDKNAPEWLQNAVLRHENCHIRQYKSGLNTTRDQREIECYIRMWFK